CSREGCRRRPSYNFPGRKAAYCHNHKAQGMINTISKRCAAIGCTKQPLAGVKGIGKSRFCRLH
ncbi:hypothetical protein JKP88DRAFT_154969, partial [Tribonema minus]